MSRSGMRTDACRRRGSTGHPVAPLSRVGRCFIDQKSLRITAALLSCVMSLAPTLAFAGGSVAPGVNQIVPDGRTATNIQSSGSVTTITTATVSGQTGFNSFSQFREGAGNTVNMALPGGTSNLVNVVRDGPAVVNGVLNSYKDGKIGGNVYFADSYGFVVGRSGVINTGTLNVSTPSKAFVDGLIGPQGQINAAATNQLMNGNVPLSPDGFIAIRGRVNALEGARLIGQNVSVGPRNRAEAAQLDHAGKFAASVNSKGLRTGSGIVVRNGSIQIVAGNTARVNGRLSARSRAHNAGTISVAARNISMGAKARLSAASRDGNGGAISVKAGNNLAVEAGARFDVSSLNANAGSIELSAKNVAAVATATYNLSAPHGKAGSLLIDPYDLVVSGHPELSASGSSDDYTYSGSIYSNGGNVTLTADHSITIDATGVVDTRVAGGKSGDISITAPNITVLGKLLADGSLSGSSAGDITLTASQINSDFSGKVTAATSILINGTLTGRNITATATASATSSFNIGTVAWTEIAAANAANPTGLTGGWVAADTSAKVIADSHANITASGNVSLISQATSVANDPAVDITMGSPVGAAVVVGQITGNSVAQIKSGATISADGALKVNATNNATLTPQTLTIAGVIGTQTQAAVASIAYGSANIQSSATIDSGAVISKAGSVSVLAHNQNDFAVKASAYGFGPAKAGLTVAVSDISTSAVARIGADLGTAQNPVGSVAVEAGSTTTQNLAQASTTVGTSKLAAVLATLSLATDFYKTAPVTVTGASAFAFSQAGKAPTGSSSTPKVSGSTAVVNSSIASSASIDADSGAAAPKVYSSGDVSVIGDMYATGLSSLAISGVNSEASKPTASNPQATTALAVAVSIGNFSHSAVAYIGSGATVEGAHIGVGARTNIPLGAWLTDWSSAAAVFEGLYDTVATNPLIGSGANASSQGKGFEFAGAANFISYSNNTVAWIGSGATLKQTDALAPSSWTTTTANGSLDWSGAVAVQARSHVESLNVGGLLGLQGGVGGQGADSSAVGGAFNSATISNTTIAGIGDSASVTAASVVGGVPAVDVSAKAENWTINLAPLNGTGTGIGGTGLYSSIGITDTTHASISNLATVSAQAVGVYATEDLQVYSFSGSFAGSSEAGVGLSLAISQLVTDTAAYVGDNHADISAAIDPNATGIGTHGSISTSSLTVTATTYGTDVAGSIAAERISDDPNSAPASTPPKAASLLGATPTKSTTQLGVAGSTAVAIHQLTTRAALTSADIRPWVPNSDLAVAVNAENNMLMVSVSGAAALDSATKTGNQKTFTAAIAGAIAVGISDNDTEATIATSSLSNVSSLQVNALAGGLEAVVGLGVGLNQNADAQKSASVAGSVSVAKVTDAVRSGISDSTITADSVVASAVGVNAYQSTDIGIGGGSFYKGGRAGIGLAITYALVQDPSSGDATRAAITNTSMANIAALTVAASDPARIFAGAAMLGLNTPNGLGGAFVISDIGRSTSAQLSGGPNADTLAVNGSITVSADDARNATYANLLGSYGADPGAPNSATGDAPAIDFQATSVTNLTDPGGSVLGDGAAIVSVAGVFQVDSSNKKVGMAGIGVGVVDAYIHQRHSALIDQLVVNAPNADVAVVARDSAAILSVGVGLGLQGDSTKFSGQAAVSENRVDSDVVAQIGGADATPLNTSISASNVIVDAEAGAAIRSFAVAAASGQKAAAGLAIAYNSVDGNVDASLDGVKIGTANDLRLTAQSAANILTVAVGVADGNSGGLAGSTSTNLMGTDVSATVSGSDLIAGGNVLVAATNNDGLAVIAGALGLGGSAGAVGVSVVTNTIDGDTIASISGNSLVDARGGAAPINVNGGTLANPFDLTTATAPTATPPDLSENQIAVAGLVVVATSHQSVVTDAITLGLATGNNALGLAVVTVINTMGGATTASIDGSLIDTRLNAGDRAALDVIASSQSYSGNFVVGGSAAATAGTGAVDDNKMNRRTSASITNASVGTAPTGSAPMPLQAVAITASASQLSSNLAVGFAVAKGSGGAASGIINVFNADTRAYFDAGSVVAGAMNVTAHSSNGYFAATGAGAFAGGNGIAGAFMVGVSQNTTLAYVGSATTATALSLDGGLAIAAQSDNAFTGYAIGAAGAGGNGIAGMATVTIISNDTEATLTNASVVQRATATEVDTDANNAPVTNPAGVKVTATETINVAPTAGAGGVGLEGTGIGAGANVVLLSSALAASSTGSRISSPGTVLVSSQSKKYVNAETVTIGAGGSVGIGAAVAVILLGTGVPTGLLADLDAGGAGTLSSVNTMGANDNFLLTQSGLSAFRAAAASSLQIVNPTDQQVQAYAKQQYETLLSNGTFRDGAFVLNTSAIPTYRAAAATALGIANPTDQEVQGYALSLYSTLTTNRTGYVLADSAIPQLAGSLLGATDLATYQQLAVNGTAKDGDFTLSSAGLNALRSQAATALNIPNPTDQQVQDYAAGQYARIYQSLEIAADAKYRQLLADGTVTRGQYVLGTPALASYVPAALGTSDYANYQSLLANGTVANGVFTLNVAAIPAYQAAAAQALNVANPTDQQVQDYAASQYAGYIQQARNYASDQYQQFAVNRDTGTTPYSVAGALGAADDAVIATISGGTVTAGAVLVSANAAVSTKSVVAGGALSGGVGVGAAVGYTRVNDTVVASLNQATVNASSVTIDAKMTDGQGGVAGKVAAYAGSGGLAAAIGASVADVKVSNTVDAVLGGTIGGVGAGASPAVSVSANDNSSVRSDAFGATVSGGAALGISLASAVKESTVEASVLDSANVTASSLAVTAASASSVFAAAVAGVGGLYVAGNGSEADATDRASVSARLGAATVDVGTGAITLSATDTPDAKALAFGATISGGLAVGVSLASASVSPTVLAEVDGGAMLTAGTLSVIAAATFAGTPSYSVPATLGTPPSTDDFALGETSAASWAIAGSGSLYLSATGTTAQSSDTANITAKLDDGLALPNGDVSVIATNSSNQVARGVGLTVGGILAVGVVESVASADTTTSASIGAVRSALNRQGNLVISATSSDFNTALSQSGSGGLLAGSGATATTRGTSTTNASIGLGAAVLGTDLTLAASHVQGFSSSVDSLSASVIGGSASLARNDYTANTTASIGDGVILGVADGLTITAHNDFHRIGSSDSADAAAGGGINGAGATSVTTITGSAAISFGANDTVTTGIGGINALASSSLSVTDVVSLTTGGLIQGAGVDSSLTATLNNSIAIADSQSNAIGQFSSQGAINLGTYTEVSVSTVAAVSTYGLASVGAASAETTIVSSQDVSVGANTVLLAVGNVNLMAGYDPVLSRLTSIVGDAGAYGYVYGIIAVPDSHANTSLTSNASVEVAAGAQVLSAGNITIGAYHGSPDASAEGVGKGYELGFIPVSISESSVGTPRSATVTIDGTVVAGLYREQTVAIGCGKAVCGLNDPAQLQLLSGAPVVVNGVMLSALTAPSQLVNAQMFDASGYVAANFDPEVAPVMQLGVSQTPVPGFMIGSLFASGGNVTINADTIAGAGSVKALGGPTINLVNTTSAYVVLQAAYIPDTPGGQILFTGGAQRGDVGSVRLIEDIKPNGYDISIAMNYQSPNAGSGGLPGPAFINAGNITNLGGSVNMTNATGWFGQLGDVVSRSVTESAPFGGLVVSAVNPGQMFSAGSFPYSDWVNYMNFPGSPVGSAPALLDPLQLASAANTVVAYIANLYALGMDSRISDPTQLNGTYITPDAQGLLNLTLYGQAGNIVLYVPGFYTFGGVQLSSNNTSTVFLGSCAWSALGNCSGQASNGVSPLGQSYVLNGNSTGTQIYEPVIPYYVTRGIDGLPTAIAANSYLLTAASYSSASIPNLPPKTFSSPGLIKAFGGPVAIKADIININGTIETGRPNSWSVDLPQSLMAAATTQQVVDHLAVSFNGFFPVFTPVYRTVVTGGGEIAQYQAKYDIGQAQLAAGTFLLNTSYEKLSSTVTLTTTVAHAPSDQRIDVSYNATTKSVSLSDVNASSGGGFVLLDGKIINTGPTAGANINVNGGLGQVVINNLTGLPVAVNNVNNGTLADGQPVVSRVKIIDRLADPAANTTTYLFTPGVGMTEYKTGNGADPTSATPVFYSTTGNTTQFTPVTGARFVYSQEADVVRDAVLDSSGNVVDFTPWRFKQVQTGGNPWYFVAANGALVGDDQAQGHVVIDTSLTGTAFMQTMSASVGAIYDQFHGYGCTGGPSCNYGFAPTPSNPGYASWDYLFPMAGSLRLTSSVKADNPFNISFFGNATASLNIASDASVALNGNITNPSGTTTIDISSGNLTQSATSTFQTGNLKLDVAGGIGTSAQPLIVTLSANAVIASRSGTVAAPADAGPQANNTYLKFTSGALIDKVAAGSAQTGWSDVSMTAAGNIARALTHIDGSAMAADDVNIAASNISLTSATGSVGSSTSPLVLSANYTTAANGSLSGGVVTVSAVGDVGLSQVAGLGQAVSVDLRIGSIATSGDAYINVFNGTLVDASGRTASSTLSDSQVAANSARLHLTVADDASQNAIQTGIVSFENLFNSSYTQYFTLRAVGSVSTTTQIAPADLAAVVSIYRPLAEAAQIEAARQSGQNFVGTTFTALTDAQVLAFAADINARNGVFSLNAPSIAIYRPLAAAALGIAAPTDAQVQAYANAKYQSYAGVFARGVGADWSSQTEFQAMQPAFVFHVDPSSSLAQALTAGSVWDSKQLIASINQTPISVGNAMATIAARNITVTSTGGSIGNTAGAAFITLSDLRAGTLTTAQQKALAGATPGSVVAVAADGSEYAIDRLPTGIAFTGIRVTQTAPVFVSANGMVSGQATTDIYIQSTSTPNIAGQTLQIGTMQAGGNVSLVAPLAIVASTVPTLAPVQITAGGDLTLLTDSSLPGSIGSKQTPLTYSAGGHLIAAVAGQDIYLKSMSDASLGRVQAGGALSIETVAGDITSYLNNTVLSGQFISLVARGDIGTASQALLVKVGAGGELNGSATGAAFLYSPTLPGDPTVNPLHIGTFSAGGDLAIASDTDLTATTLTSTSGAVTVASGANATLGTVTGHAASRSLQLSAVGDLAVSQIFNPGGIDVAAGGLLSIGSGGIVQASAGAVSVQAASLLMGSGSIVAGATGVRVTTTGDLAATMLTSATGDVSVDAGGSASIATASAGGNLAIMSVADLIATTLTSTGGMITAVSRANATLGTVVAHAMSQSIQLGAAGRLAATEVSNPGGIGVVAGSLLSIVDGGAVQASAGTVNVQAGALTMGSGSMMAGASSVSITTSGDVTATTLASSTGNIAVKAGGVFSEAANGELTASLGAIGVTADQITMGQLARMTASTIVLEAARDVTLGALVGTANPVANSAPVINVSAGSSTVAGAIISNGDGQINITTVRPNAAVVLVAGGGIGVDSQLAPPVTPSQPPRPITVNVPLLSASTMTGDINIVGIGDLRLLQASAPHGNVNISTRGRLQVEDLSGDEVNFSTPGDLIIGEIDVANSLTLGGRTIQANIVQVPGSPSPLNLNLTGPNGGVAQSIMVTIDAPSTEIGNLFAIDALIATTGQHLGIRNGFVTGRMVLNMPGQNIVLDNRSPAPLLGPTVQLYGPGVPFTLEQSGNTTITSDFAVTYGVLANVTALNVFQGMSFVRDFPRSMLNGDPFAQPPLGKAGTAFDILGISPSFMLDADAIPKPVESAVSGPAVNLDGLQ